MVKGVAECCVVKFKMRPIYVRLHCPVGEAGPTMLKVVT